MNDSQIQEFLNRRYYTLRIAQEVNESIDKNVFADYEKKLAALFFLRSDLLKEFTLSNDNGKVTLKPKEGVIKDVVLKSIYENCKGSIDYIETLVQVYYSKAEEKSDKYINEYLRHFFEVTERQGHYILKSPLAYGDYNGNDNTKVYENLAFLSWQPDYDVKLSDEEIQLVIALASLSEKLEKRGECNNHTSNGTYGDLYYPTFQKWTYHSDLIDNIIENYPDLMKKMKTIVEKTNDPDYHKVYYKAYHLLQVHKEKRTIEDIREVNKEEQERYVTQLNTEISNSNGRDTDAQEKLNNVMHNEQLKIEEQRRKQRLNEVNNNVDTVKTLLDTIRIGFNQYDIYMAQYIYVITNGNYNNLSQINPELYPYVQKPLEYLNLVYGTIKRINGTLTNNEVKYVIEQVFGNLDIGQLLSTITVTLAGNLVLSEPTLPKGVDPMEKYDLVYDPERIVGVYKFPAFDILLKQNPNLSQILEKNGVKKVNGGYDYRTHWFIENYIKGEFMDINKSLTSYIENEKYQSYQENIKKFLEFEQSDRRLQDNLTEEYINDYHFGRR